MDYLYVYTALLYYIMIDYIKLNCDVIHKPATDEIVCWYILNSTLR